MNILHIGIDLAPRYGGIYRSVCAFTRALVENGDHPQVLNFGAPGGPAGEFDCPSEHVGITPLPWLTRYRFWSGFWTGGFERLAGTPDVAVIHGAFYHAAAAGAAYFRRRGIPYLFVSHGSLDPYVFTYRRLRKRTWTRIYRKRLLVDSSAVLFSTAEEARRAALWTGGSRTEVLFFPTNLVSDYDKSRARAAMLERFGLKPDQRIALYCGRVDGVKRPLEMIREFKATRMDDWVLFLVGPSNDPALAGAVDAACRQPGPRCLYAGAVYGDGLREFFRAADLFLLLSHKENFSHVTAEALAHGVPAFLSKGVNLWRDLEPVRCAWAVPDGAIEQGTAHAELARVLALGREELEAAGQRGRQWAREALSPETFRHRFCGLIQSAFAGALGTGARSECRNTMEGGL